MILGATPQFCFYVHTLIFIAGTDNRSIWIFVGGEWLPRESRQFGNHRL